MLLAGVGLVVLGVVGAVLYFVGVLAGFPVLGMGGALVLVAVFGELAVYGVEGFSGRVGLSGYASSVLVNSVAVFPELFSALALGFRGVGSGDVGLAEIALLSVLVSASFNFVVLGVVGLLAGGIRVSGVSLHYELPLMRVAVASTGLVAAYGVVEASLGASGGPVAAPVALLVASLVYWAYYVGAVVWSGRGGSGGGAGHRYWWVLLAAGVGGMVLAAEGLAGSVEEMIHLLRIEHVGEAALAVGVASSTPEAVLAVLAAWRGRAREAAGGLVAATSTSLLLVYPLVYLPLAAFLPLDAFTAYSLAMLAAVMWVAKRSFAHENFLDRGESLYILALTVSGMAVLAYVK